MANKKHIEVKHMQITDYLKQKLIHMVYDNLCCMQGPESLIFLSFKGFIITSH